MRLMDYLFLGTLDLAGCAEPTKRQVVIHESIEDKFDKPIPRINIRPREAIILAPNSTVGLLVEDHSQRRLVRNVAIYFAPEGGKSFKLDITGSPKELERTGQSHYCWNVRKQFSQIPEGHGRIIVYVFGKNETGVCEVPIVLGKYNETMFK